MSQSDDVLLLQMAGRRHMLTNLYAVCSMEVLVHNNCTLALQQFPQSINFCPPLPPDLLPKRSGIIVQLAGSKTWVLYDEMVPFPRVDQHYKPASADLGEPIAVIELHPGDMMYIPR